MTLAEARQFGTEAALQPAAASMPASARGHQPITMTAPPSDAVPVGFTAVGPAGKGPVTFQAPAAIQLARASTPAVTPRRNETVRLLPRSVLCFWSIAPCLQCMQRSLQTYCTCTGLSLARNLATPV